MTFTNGPRPVAALLGALRDKARARFCGEFRDDATVVELGRRYEGKQAIEGWADRVLSGTLVMGHPIDVVTREGITIVTFWVRRQRDDASIREPEQLEWRVIHRDDRIASLTVEEGKLPALPDIVMAFVRAMNTFDLASLVGLFADDALVNDQLREWQGKDAIREWAARDIVGDKMTMHVVGAVDHYEACLVTANIDGDFDKRGLPQPFVMTFYFSSFQDKIVRLIILRADP
jgi:SnoaL-like domain